MALTVADLMKLGAKKSNVAPTPVAKAVESRAKAVPSTALATLSVTPQPEPVVDIQSELNALDKTAVMVPAEGFKQKLDDFDALVSAASGIGKTEIDGARMYVSTIMTELKEHPEYEPILIDRDVHNVMLFVQASRNMATANFVVQKEKAAKRVSKKAEAASMTFDPTIMLGDMSKDSRLNQAMADSGLADLANLNLDSIPAKDSRGKK